MAWDDNLQGPARDFAASDAERLRALAGPGTGKTFALLRRTARLLEEGVDPREILVVTFARTAAEDLKQALARLGEDVQLTARTLHSLCFAILNREGVLHITGRTPRILLEFERDHLLQDLSGPLPGGLRVRRKLTFAFEAAWARLQTDDPGEPVAGLDQAFQDALLDALRWYGAMLIGEVVPLALSYLRHNPNAPELAAHTQVLVDEYQDLNRAEQGVIDLLSEHGHLAVIGDDDQSIYGFKCANPDGIRTFDQTHPGTVDVQLTECRRCPKRVVRMAQTLIQRNPGRVRGPLFPRDQNPEGEIHNVQWTSIAAEANGIARFVRQAVDSGVDPGQCLILANSREIGYAIRDAVLATGVPIRSFFREEAVQTEAAQEALTLLTLLGDPADRVALRCWLAFRSTTRREAPYRRLLTQARAQGSDVASVLGQLDQRTVAIPYTAEILERWRTLTVRLADLAPLADGLGHLVNALFPVQAAGDAADELTALRSIATGALAECQTVERLQEVVRYRLAQPEVPLQTPYARVMSFHKSKGLTAEVVVLAGLVEGLIPRIDPDALPGEQQEALEEQRRLFFVGMTRTTRVLVLSSYSELDDGTVHHLQIGHGKRFGRAFRTLTSRFVAELGRDLPRAVRGEDWLPE